MIELKFEQEEPRPLQRYVSFAASEKLGSAGLLQGQSAAEGLTAARYIDSCLSGGVIRAQFYREVKSVWPQPGGFQRKGVLCLLQASRLRLFGLEPATIDQSGVDSDDQSVSTQLKPLLNLSLDSCIPPLMMPVAAKIERIDFNLGLLDLWVLTKPSRVVSRPTKAKDRILDGITSGRETDRTLKLTDREYEQNGDYSTTEPHNPTAIAEEVFYISLNLITEVYQRVRCLLMNTHHLEALSNTSQINSNYTLEVARQEESIAILLTKGSEHYLGLLLDATELLETSLVQFTVVWGRRHQVTQSNLGEIS